MARLTIGSTVMLVAVVSTLALPSIAGAQEAPPRPPDEPVGLSRLGPPESFGHDTSDRSMASPFEASSTSRRTQRESERERLAREETAAYCEHLRAAQESESARLRSPWLSARASTLQVDELAASPGEPLALRARVGLGFSVSDWLRADIMEAKVGALCDVHQLEVEARPQERELDAITAVGWNEKARVIEQFMEQAETLLKRSEAELQSNQRTVTEHLRTLEAHRLLREQAFEARARFKAASEHTAPVKPDVARQRRLQAGLVRLERAAGELRRNESFNVSVEAGYDEILGIDQELPLYGQLNIVFRPGYLWQAEADDRSAMAKGRAALRELQAQDLKHDGIVQHAALRQEAIAGDVERLQTYLPEIERQRHVLIQTQSLEAQVVAEQLWFEVVLQRAELARLRAARRALDIWLAEQSAGQSRTPTMQDSSLLD